MNDHLKRGDEISWRPYPRWLVHALEQIDKIYIENKRPNTIEKNDIAWDIAERLFKIWKKAYPEEYRQHVQEMKQIKSGAYNKHAASPTTKEGKKEVGAEQGGQIRHVVSMPGRYHHLLMQYFPQQSMHKRFLHKLAKRIPELKVPDKI